MKTLKEFCSTHKDYSKLIKSVYKQLESKSDEEFFGVLGDVVLVGASAGFTGYIYYREVPAFFKKNREDIIDLLYEDAEGQSPSKMIKNFPSIRDNEYVDEIDINKALYGPVKDNDCDLLDLYAVFAWYALEKVAYWYNDDKENELLK